MAKTGIFESEEYTRDPRDAKISALRRMGSDIKRAIVELVIDLPPENESRSNVTLQRENSGYWLEERGDTFGQQEAHGGGDHRQAEAG